MNKRELRQQQGINQALKAWSQNHETRLPVRPIARTSEPIKPKFVESTMCELGLIIPIGKARQGIFTGLFTASHFRYR